MAHRLFLLLGKIYWIYRIITDLISDYIFGFFYHGKHQPLPPIKDAVLLESASSLARKIRTQQLKSVDVVKAYINRIHEVNLILNAMCDQRFAEAILEAQRADALIASGEKSVEQFAIEFPFLGVPFTTKDSLSVKGLRNTGGLVSRKNHVADSTVPAVQQMIDSGAVLLGVCNISELTFWLECSNHVYGRTNNAYDTTRTCGGSTGGDGTLIAACGTPFAIGTDIGGSVRIPSYCSGIFGHKVTRGSVSIDGMLPSNPGELPNYNTVGPMCRYADDLIPMYKTLIKSKEVADKLKLDQPVDLRTIKIYYTDSYSGYTLMTPPDAEIRNAINKAIVHLEKMYGIKAVKVHLKELDDSPKIYGAKLKTSCNGTFSQLLANGKGEVNGVVEFLKSLFGCSDHSMPAIFLSMYEKILSDDEDFVHDANTKANSLQRQFTEMLGDNGVFFYPTQPKPAYYHNQMLAHLLNFAYCGIFNILGLPSTQVPMGLNSQGLPIGFQIVGNYFNDRISLAIAKDLEKAFGGWVAPSPIRLS